MHFLFNNSALICQLVTREETATIEAVWFHTTQIKPDRQQMQRWIYWLGAFLTLGKHVKFYLHFLWITLFRSPEICCLSACSVSFPLIETSRSVPEQMTEGSGVSDCCRYLWRRKEEFRSTRNICPRLDRWVTAIHDWKTMTFFNESRGLYFGVVRTPVSLDALKLVLSLSYKKGFWWHWGHEKHQQFSWYGNMASTMEGVSSNPCWCQSCEDMRQWLQGQSPSTDLRMNTHRLSSSSFLFFKFCHFF